MKGQGGDSWLIDFFKAYFFPGVVSSKDLTSICPKWPLSLDSLASSSVLNGQF